MTTTTATSAMTSTSLEPNDPKDSSTDKDTDTKPPPAIIPLRQRRLPASFWQEPSIIPNTPVHQGNLMSSPNQPFLSATNHLQHPWTIGGPTYLPQRLSMPSGSLAMLQHHPSAMWIRSPALSYCSCTVCLNYSCMPPRIPDLYSGLRYRPNVAGCCPTPNCTEIGCKMCTVSGSWCPERVRQTRLRSARYNALLD
ncbi:hypothetical protein JTE90_007112 [Oedothorax gibbosus]|uniref:Uncharacterized protein n=1 Tax=Oedothorax gibbosus TaxID=931172 RepID=A0AAV6VRD8_9ARAC|nr:hypothetical protein JTE90_007112 [Oedothorax gibbosus]